MTPPLDRTAAVLAEVGEEPTFLLMDPRAWTDPGDAACFLAGTHAECEAARADGTYGMDNVVVELIGPPDNSRYGEVTAGPEALDRRAGR